MIDAFVLLTPILLLLVVALLGFVGCYVPVTLSSPPLVHVQTVVNSQLAGTNTLTADTLTLQGGELIVVAVQWSSPISGPDMPQLAGAGASFTPVSGGGPFAWNNLKVQIFSTVNPPDNRQLAVTATLLRPSTVPWNLCVSAYAGVDESAPFYSPENSALNYVGNNPHTAAFNVDQGDLVYAVAFAANGDGTFPGNASLTAGPGFTAEFPQVTNPLVEDGSGANPFVAQVTNSNPDPSAKGFIFSIGLNSADSSNS